MNGKQYMLEMQAFEIESVAVPSIGIGFTEI